MKKRMNWMKLVLFLIILLLAAGCSQLGSPKTPDKITITFTDTGCSLSGPQEVPAGIIEMDWITTSDVHDIYGIAILTLDDGRTIEDLNKWKSLDEPPWADVVSFRDAKGKTTTELFINLDKEKESFYFVCFDPDQIIGALGPVGIIQ